MVLEVTARNLNETDPQKQKERFLMNFDTDTEEVEIEANLSYFIKGSEGHVVHSVKELLIYDTY